MNAEAHSYAFCEGAQVWVAPGIGFADDYLHVFQGIFTDSHVVMAAIFILFAVLHSGMAYLRPYGELKSRCDLHLLVFDHTATVLVLQGHVVMRGMKCRTHFSSLGATCALCAAFSHRFVLSPNGFCDCCWGVCFPCQPTLLLLSVLSCCP